MDEIPDIPDSPTAAPTREMAGLNVSSGGKLETDEIPDIDDIPDMDEEGLEDLDDDAAVRIVHPSEAEVNSTAGKNLLQVRTYDCIISYDKHYQTPRFWLFGYDEVSLFICSCLASNSHMKILKHKNPLAPAQVFQDVPADHAFKTMTMESFPHSGAQLASVHPCKHASVMKKFIDRMEAAQGPAPITEPETISSTSGTGGSAGGKEEKEKKKKWGLGGMVRKVTGGGVPKVEKDKDEVVTGVPVDFYLVIVCLFFLI